MWPIGSVHVADMLLVQKVLSVCFGPMSRDCCSRQRQELTVGLVAGAEVDGSTEGDGMFAAFCTSLRFEPFWLATRFIFPFVRPWPFFFSAAAGFVDSVSSCTTAVARDAFGGIRGAEAQKSRILVLICD